MWKSSPNVSRSPRSRELTHDIQEPDLRLRFFFLGTMQRAKENYNLQKKVAAFTALLFLLKVLAWYLTQSVAILTDALEYTINLTAALVGLYSLKLSAQPRDHNHPYGHGKAEFLSAAIEGTLMIVSSFLIIYEAINNLRHPHHISAMDTGILITAGTALVNWLMGWSVFKHGKKNHSLALQATGKHMQSDTYATVGIIAGLLLLMITGFQWIDSVTALVFAFIIIISGYKILRSSIAGMMDEADQELLVEMVQMLEHARRPTWIDLHNLRIIKYGGMLHLDCHLTVPWYLNVHEAHMEIDDLDRLVKENFGDSVEMFVHTDGCLDFSCGICGVLDCPERKSPMVKSITWTVENISRNDKHHSGTLSL